VRSNSIEIVVPNWHSFSNESSFFLISITFSITLEKGRAFAKLIFPLLIHAMPEHCASNEEESMKWKY
jgi:hypothetical protein